MPCLAQFWFCFILAIEDILEDLQKGDGFNQIALDLLVVSSIAGILTYIYVLQPLKTRREHQKLMSQSSEQNADLHRLAQIAEKQLQGLGVYIKAQFEQWVLTDAE